MKPWKRKKLKGVQGPIVHASSDCMFEVLAWTATGRYQIAGFSPQYKTKNEAIYTAMKRHDRELRKAAKLLSRYKLLTEHYPLHPEEPE